MSGSPGSLKDPGLKMNTCLETGWDSLHPGVLLSFAFRKGCSTGVKQQSSARALELHSCSSEILRFIINRMEVKAKGLAQSKVTRECQPCQMQAGGVYSLLLFCGDAKQPLLVDSFFLFSLLLVLLQFSGLVFVLFVCFVFSFVLYWFLLVWVVLVCLCVCVYFFV